MTGGEGLAIGLTAAWFIAIVAVVGLCAAASAGQDQQETEPTDEDSDGLFAADYTTEFEAMRSAFATAVRETEPGQPSADLSDCWGIWPDATPVGEEGAA
ncbi:hypothetical protein [Streptomyces chryseus]